MSGGMFMGATDVEQATVYLDACSGGMIPIDVSRAWAERAVGVQAWARSIGIESMHAAGGWYPTLPGFDSIEVSGRSEERRVGKECVSTCSTRWWAYQ